MNMKVYIPMATGQMLETGVEESIQAQTVPCEIVPCYTPGVIESQRNFGADRHQGEIASRQLCVDMASKTNDEFVCMQDRDIVHLNTGNIREMQEFLITHAHWGAVSLYWKDIPDKRHLQSHVRITCVMVRTALFKWINWAEYSTRPCRCATFKEQINAMEYEYGYLDCTKRIEEVF